jgi:outer membrane protein TolC
MGNQFNFFGSDGNWYPTTIWGLNLSIPIFSSGQGASVVNQAKITLEKTQNSIELMDQGLQLQMSQSVSSFNSAIETKKTRLKAIEIAQEVLRTSEIKYKEKVISSMELTQAQSQVIQAKTNLITAKFEVLKAKLAMDKLTNKL